ncbi:MAG TPA: hypothetical protein PKM25_09925 [Candidatus Ozemobacteraceae bacterium]|nr:hypothetical protein [Candidatus Ozemobacteraceae bacterium]
MQEHDLMGVAEVLVGYFDDAVEATEVLTRSLSQKVVDWNQVAREAEIVNQRSFRYFEAFERAQRIIGRGREENMVSDEAAASAVEGLSIAPAACASAGLSGRNAAVGLEMLRLPSRATH